MPRRPANARRERRHMRGSSPLAPHPGGGGTRVAARLKVCTPPTLPPPSGGRDDRAELLQPPGHDEGVDDAEARVPEGAGKAADDLEAEALPQVHGALVRSDHEVELHRQEAARAAPPPANARPSGGQCHGRAAKGRSHRRHWRRGRRRRAGWRAGSRCRRRGRPPRRRSWSWRSHASLARPRPIGDGVRLAHVAAAGRRFRRRG